jgi:hypothetical protein
VVLEMVWLASQELVDLDEVRRVGGFALWLWSMAHMVVVAQ